MRVDELIKSSPLTGPTARLDTELLLASVVDKNRTWLATWPDKVLSSDQVLSFQALIDRRVQGEPVAYILERQAFWDADLFVSPSVLIPRPETEALVEWVLELGGERIADLGTGSGALAIAIARELKDATVEAFDLSEDALAVATKNVAQWAPGVSLHQGSWLSGYQGKAFDVIVSNPPYIDVLDQQVASNVRRYEPDMALFADEQGLKDIRDITQQARKHLVPNGWLLFEHGLEQGDAVRSILSDQGFSQIQTRQDLAGLDRLTGGRL